MTKVRFLYVKNIRPYAIAGHLIRWFERKTSGLDASHCQVEIIDGKESLIIESIFPSGRITRQSDKYQLVEVYEFEVDKSVDDILKYARKTIVGRPYSFIQNGFLGLVGIFMHWLKIRVWDLEKYEINGRNVQNCTEAQLIMAGYLLNCYVTESLDNYSVGEARDIIKSIREVKA